MFVVLFLIYLCHPMNLYRLCMQYSMSTLVVNSIGELAEVASILETPEINTEHDRIVCHWADPRDAEAEAREGRFFVGLLRKNSINKPQSQ